MENEIRIRMSSDRLRLDLFYEWCNLVEKLYFEWKQLMLFYLYGNTSNPFKRIE